MREVDGKPSDSGFAADLGTSLRVIRARPLLPILSLIVWTAPALLPPSAGILAFPISIFSIGFPGTQRLWLLRGFRGQDFSFNDAFHVTWKYFWRFVVLGLLVAPAILLGGGLGFAVSGDFVGLFVGFAIATLVVDFALTFVTPALAFVTRRASEALSIGIRLIRTDWPRTLLYVLVPPLALVILGNVLFISGAVREFDQQLEALRAGRRPPPVRESFQLVSAAMAAAGTLLGLWFKGATAAFFVRRFDVGPDGSVGPAVPAPPRPDLAHPAHPTGPGG